MQDLIIIGNGFDKAHNLKTDYKDFINYLLNEANENPNKFENLFTYKERYGIRNLAQFKSSGAEPSHIIKTDNLFFLCVMSDFQSQNWCDFENLYFEFLSGQKNHYSKGVKELNYEFQIIKNHLKDYLIHEQNNFKVLQVYSEFFQKIESSRESSLVLNFNYTNTVKKYVDNFKKVKLIPIHGELEDDANPIIFGYAADDNDCVSLLKRNDNEYLQNIKKHAYKRTSYNEELKNFIDDSGEIRVSIFGHSCGISDKLVLKEIFSHQYVKEIFIYYFEKYDDYYEKQVNINRISLNDVGLNKVKNFKASQRMPQYIDSNDKHDEFIRFCSQIYG